MNMNDALSAIDKALEESENWTPSDINKTHDVPDDFYENNDNDINYEVYEDGDFNFVEPTHRAPRNDIDRPNRVGRLYNESLPLKISMLVDVFNISNQRYINHYFTNGLNSLLTTIVDDDPYEAGLMMLILSVLLTTSKEDELRSHLTAAIEMIWDSYTNACYGYIDEDRSLEESFLSHFEYNMFYMALNFLNLFHSWLHPLEVESGRFQKNPYAVSRFTVDFLNRDDVVDHLYRIQPDFDDKEPPKVQKKQSKGRRKNNKNRYKGKNHHRKGSR